MFMWLSIFVKIQRMLLYNIAFLPHPDKLRIQWFYSDYCKEISHNPHSCGICMISYIFWYISMTLNLTQITNQLGQPFWSRAWSVTKVCQIQSIYYKNWYSISTFYILMKPRLKFVISSVTLSAHTFSAIWQKFTMDKLCGLIWSSKSSCELDNLACIKQFGKQKVLTWKIIGTKRKAK